MLKNLMNQVEDAIAREAATRELATYVRGFFSDQCGGDPRRAGDIESKTDFAMSFIFSYVQGAPALLASLFRAGRDAGVHDDLIPVFLAAEDYFLQSADVLPDHLGLAGLADDAYLAQSLLWRLSFEHFRLTFSPLIPYELSPANALMRTMIGEPAATTLDAGIDAAMGVRDVQIAREHLAQKVRTLQLDIPPPPALPPGANQGMELRLASLAGM